MEHMTNQHSIQAQQGKKMFKTIFPWEHHTYRCLYTNCAWRYLFSEKFVSPVISLDL